LLLALVTKTRHRAAGASQSQPAEDQGDRPQHQGRCGADYSVATARPTGGESQIQSSVDYGEEPRNWRDGSALSAVTGTDTTGGWAQSHPTYNHTDQREHSSGGCPESPGRKAVDRDRGWLGKVRGHQHDIHKARDQGDCSQGSKNESERPFHGILISDSNQQVRPAGAQEPDRRMRIWISRSRLRASS
jgi:hypothetical protein